MLRRLELENFKGVGSRVELEFKPVTLLFGPNSAGKSTVLHALHVVHALLEHSSPDVERSRIGGRGLDLGGFQTFVHNRDRRQPVRIALEFEPDIGDVLSVLDEPFDAVETLYLDYSQQVRHIRVEIEMRWSELADAAIVRRYAVEIDRKPFCVVEATEDGASSWATSINGAHPCLDTEADKRGPEEQADHAIGVEALRQQQYPCLPGRRSALPWTNRHPGFVVGSFDDDLMERRVGSLLHASAALLKSLLDRFRYVGPVRLCPPRAYEPPRRRDEGRWADGLGAWDAMSASPTLREEVSQWLRLPERCGTGYRIDEYAYRAVPDGAWQQVRNALVHEGEAQPTPEFLLAPRRTRLVMMDEAKELELDPCDLGEGISQVVPVIAAALATENDSPDGKRIATRLVAIEQPELHIHPRMQVALGDLFLANMGERQFLVETHSEHLVLRLLRRIRETTEGTLPPEAQPCTVDDVAVLYIHQVDGAVAVKALGVSNDGEFLEDWPGGFFDERAKEIF
jgi:hypothetical protein